MPRVARIVLAGSVYAITACCGSNQPREQALFRAGSALPRRARIGAVMFKKFADLELLTDAYFLKYLDPPKTTE